MAPAVAVSVTAVAVMHKHMQQWAGKQQQQGKIRDQSLQMGFVLGPEEIASDPQEPQENQA